MEFRATDLPASRGAWLDAFHGLVQDAHVRRYLVDGQVMPREWSAAGIRDSLDLFARRGVGLRLASERESGEVVGFCGFLEIPSVHPDPQLVHALVERFAGRGCATGMAPAAMELARDGSRFDIIIAAVDEANAASVRVLRKLGFETVEAPAASDGCW